MRKIEDFDSMDSTELTNQTKEKMKELFYIYSNQRNTYLNLNEFKQFIKDNDIEHSFDEYDQEKITFEDFLNYYQKNTTKESEDIITDAFCSLESYNPDDGSVEISELICALIKHTTISESNIDEFIRDFSKGEKIYLGDLKKILKN